MQFLCRLQSLLLRASIQDGKYTNENQAYLGIKGGDVSSEMVAYGFPQGVYVSSVSAGSGAANAGLQEEISSLLLTAQRFLL